MNEAVENFRVPPQPHLSRVVREGVSIFARTHSVDEDDLAHFLTALGEALANAIEHSHADRFIDVEIRLNGERILASVHDDGVGFSTNDFCDAKPADPAAERGRGISIMRRCSNIFAVESAPGRGTTVVLGRYLRRSA